MGFSDTRMRCGPYLWIEYYHFVYKNKLMHIILNPDNSFEYDYTILYDGVMYKFTPSYRNSQPYIPRLGAECIQLLESLPRPL